MDWSVKLRIENSRKAKVYAKSNKMPFYESLGENPTIMFESYNGGKLHGNFLPASFSAIRKNADWLSRLNKQHSQRKSLPEYKRNNAKELDSSNSSDALLMNVFCYPKIFNKNISNLIGTDLVEPEFGCEGKIPLSNGKLDTTEIDMRIGKTIFEAKFTENDFTKQTKDIVHRYDVFHDVFDIKLLPQTKAHYISYQLIRNVLAAYHHNYRFLLICDIRRPDLLHAWWVIYGAIRLHNLRVRCGFILWQEIATFADKELQLFLSSKYGI
jgi:hypothetical protein